MTPNGDAAEVSDDALTPSLSPQEYRDEFTPLLEASQGLFAGAAEDGAAFADGRMDADEFAAAAEQRADDADGLARDLMELGHPPDGFAGAGGATDTLDEALYLLADAGRIAAEAAREDDRLMMEGAVETSQEARELIEQVPSQMSAGS